MDFWIPMALSILFEVLKNQKQAEKFQAAIYKLHGVIERTFPELHPNVREREGKLT